MTQSLGTIGTIRVWKAGTGIAGEGHGLGLGLGLDRAWAGVTESGHHTGQGRRLAYGLKSGRSPEWS